MNYENISENFIVTELHLDFIRSLNKTKKESKLKLYTELGVIGSEEMAKLKKFEVGVYNKNKDLTPLHKKV